MVDVSSDIELQIPFDPSGDSERCAGIARQT
jgi:hypothetical protein